ncbi:hypothetical protein SEA_DEJAVU_25 [Microbacterium Phage DejaVu]|nr:hypothetical protein SEA_HUBBS_24 [Microbacterium phage Hubbs]WNM66157.1 hypothetical protein SEA_DEJAVU_25 [Microbacterium Phage DejaVu]
MKKSIESLLPNGTMNLDYEMPAPEKIQLSLTFLDQFGMPMERRGFQTNLPSSPDDRVKLAHSLGEMAEKTARFMLVVSNEEEN